MDIVMAIIMGADDFVIQAFDQQVLPCRSGLLRRSYEFGRMSLLEMEVSFLIPSLWTHHHRGSSEFDQE